MEKNIFVGTVETYTKQYGMSKGTKVTAVDSKKTEEALEKLFAKHGIKKVFGPWGGSASYPFEVTVLDSYMNKKMKFRVYFKNDGGSKPFIQSNDNGEIDLAKLLAKATEAFDDYRAFSARKRAKREADEDRDAQAKAFTAQLEGTGFTVENAWGGLKIVKSHCSTEEMENMIALLVKTFKK